MHIERLGFVRKTAGTVGVIAACHAAAAPLSVYMYASRYVEYRIPLNVVFAMQTCAATNESCTIYKVPDWQLT